MALSAWDKYYFSSSVLFWFCLAVVSTAADCLFSIILLQIANIRQIYQFILLSSLVCYSAATANQLNRFLFIKPFRVQSPILYSIGSRNILIHSPLFVPLRAIYTPMRSPFSVVTEAGVVSTLGQCSLLYTSTALQYHIRVFRYRYRYESQ